MINSPKDIVQSAVHEKAEEVEAATGYWGGDNGDWPELIDSTT